MHATAKLPLMRRSAESRGSTPRTGGPGNSPGKAKENPIKFLRPTLENRNGSMDAYTGSVGDRAKLDFYDTYINLPQFSQRNKHQKLEDSPNLAYLDVVEKQKLKPNPFGIVRRKGPEGSIDIHQYSMGDAYAAAFSEGIRHIKNVATLNLKGNRLSDSGAAQILSTLETKKVKKVILAENKIAKQSIDTLVQIIRSQETRLKTLDLESTYISDKSLNTLCHVLSEDKKLVRLSLAKNNLGISSVGALVELLKYNSTIKFLDLHWNCFGIGGSVEFIKGLAANDGISHLDLSYNSFGRKDGLATARAFADMFEHNQYLRHVDLSNNYLAKKECEVIGEGLKDNHLICGLHMQGNDCYVDAKGYVVPLDYLNKTEVGHLHRRLFDTPRYKSRALAPLNCWICENWAEVTVNWKTNISGSLQNPPFFIHLECDSFKPTKLNSKEAGIFATTRMVPSGMMRFFFSDSANIAVSKEYNTQLIQTAIRVEYPSQEGEKNYISVNKVNVVFIEAEEWDLNRTPNVKPRNDPRIKERTEVVLERVKWSIEESEFKDYQFDTEEFLADCADFDYEVSNLKLILPTVEEQTEAKTVLKQHYKLITETFRQLSAISGIELFSIGKNVLNEFLKKCSFENEEEILQETGILWNLSNAPQSKGEKFNAGNGLCRYEFAEFLIRFAHVLYLKPKKCATITEAFSKLMTESIIPGMKKYDQSWWHSERYLVEDVDLFFKLHKPVITSLFQKYASLGKGNGDRMGLKEFRTMCLEAGLMNENFVMREIDMCFRQAMMTEVDEILRSEHLSMVYVEFIEALARIADQVYPDPAGTVVPLKKKLEELFKRLLELCPMKEKAGFEIPNEAAYHNMKYQRKVKVIQEFIDAQ